jgi:hypothetical protein
MLFHSVSFTVDFFFSPALAGIKFKFVNTVISNLIIYSSCNEQYELL